MALHRSTRSQQLAHQCAIVGLPPSVREHRFHESRRFRFDLAWPDCDLMPSWTDAEEAWPAPLRLAVEIEGGLFLSARGKHVGRHGSPTGVKRDFEKYAAAAARGWIVLRVLPEWIPDGRAVAAIEAVFKYYQVPITKPRGTR